MEITDHTGEVRKMGLNPVTSDHLKMRANTQSFKAYLESIGKGLIPRSQWVPINRRETLGKQFIVNQKSSSGCTGFSAAHLLMRLRALRGMSFKVLSGAFVYSQINGGHDNGSVIVEALSTLTEVGTCLREEFDLPNIFDKQVTTQARKTASRFKLAKGITFDTFDEAATALQMGFVVQFPLQVGGNFEKFSNGIAGYSDGYGNHSVGSDGMDFIAGKWVLDVPNTWGEVWGPFKNGRAYIQEKAVAGQGGSDDSYVLVDAEYDPQDENLPPAPKE